MNQCECMCHDFGGGPFHPNKKCICKGGDGFDDLSEGWHFFSVRDNRNDQ